MFELFQFSILKFSLVNFREEERAAVAENEQIPPDGAAGGDQLIVDFNDAIPNNGFGDEDMVAIRLEAQEDFGYRPVRNLPQVNLIANILNRDASPIAHQPVWKTITCYFFWDVITYFEFGHKTNISIHLRNLFSE